MSSRLRSLLVPVLASAILAGCGEKPGSPAAGPAAASPAAGAPVASGGPAVETARTLTEEKLTNYAAFRKEMVPHLALAMSSWSAKGDARTDGAKRYEALQNEACKKVGLEPAAIPGLTLLTTEYYTKTAMGIEAASQVAKAQKDLDDAKAAGKEPDLVSKAILDVQTEALKKVDETRKSYEEKYGKAVVEILKKHEAEFAGIIDLEMKAVLKPAAK